MIEVLTLENVEAAAERQDGPALFACLAAGAAAVRARAAETVLKLYAPTARLRGGLARDFGSEPDAAIKPLYLELNAAIGRQPSAAWGRFVDSLKIGYKEWREGIGYDLDALGSLDAEERSLVRQWLRSRLTNANRAIDWRELEAAAALDDRELLQTLAGHPDRDVRLRVSTLSGEGAAVERELCRVLREASDIGEIARARPLVPHYASEQVKQAMIHRLRKNDEFFVSVAMTLLEVFAGADGWAERPFLFRVKEQGVDGPLMNELLAKVGAGR